MTDRISLTDLQLIIRDTLYLSFPDSYWVIAEISEINENSTGHCYLELIEKNPDETNVRARARAIIWSNRYRFIKACFEDSTGDYLRNGIKILVKIKIEYHELYGLSLIISDIDPAFTLGEMAMKRQLIIKKLEQEGVFSMNKELRFPIAPQRIAVISSKNAAGYTDFLNHLTNNSFGYVFYTALIDSSLQGPETERSIINALDKIALNANIFDLAVIIRGGGSQSDLSWFDNYNIAYHVTQFPLPVITGIGHDKDISVTDMVANRSLKTPTAVADFLIDSVAGTENHIIGMISEIIAASRLILQKNRTRIETSGISIFPLSRIILSHFKERLSSKIIDVINIIKEIVIRAGLIPANYKSRLFSRTGTIFSESGLLLKRNNQRLFTATTNIMGVNSLKISGLKNKLELLKPENILQRGYSITSINGKILKSTRQIKQYDVIYTQLFEGKLKSRVVEKVKKNIPQIEKRKKQFPPDGTIQDLELWEK
jgi:exodeoxyribonuclease VII large subunit